MKKPNQNKKTSVGHLPHISDVILCKSELRLISVWAWRGQTAFRAFLPVPADQGELTKLTLAQCPTSHGRARGNQISQPGKWGKSSSCSPWSWEDKNSEMDGLQGLRWSLQEVSSPQRTQALPSSFLKKEISSEETDQQRLKLDPTSWIPRAWITWMNEKTKTPTKQSNQNQDWKPHHSVLTLYSGKWQQAGNRRWFPATKKKNHPEKQEFNKATRAFFHCTIS